MFDKIKAFWNKIWEWCKRSETIVYARAQVIFGIVWGVLSMTDLSPVLNGKWFTAWVVFNGVVTEYVRRMKGQSSL